MGNQFWMLFDGENAKEGNQNLSWEGEEKFYWINAGFCEDLLWSGNSALFGLFEVQHFLFASFLISKLRRNFFFNGKLENIELVFLSCLLYVTTIIWVHICTFSWLRKPWWRWWWWWLQIFWQSKGPNVHLLCPPLPRVDIWVFYGVYIHTKLSEKN